MNAYRFDTVDTDSVAGDIAFWLASFLILSAIIGVIACAL